MKKTIVASVLGMVASVAVVSSSYGQGNIAFNNYQTTAGKVTYGAGSGGTLGNGVDGTFKAALFYFVGTTSEAADPGGTATPSNLSLLPAAGQPAGYFTPFVVNGAGAGYFIGPALHIDTYASGPITFEIVAFNGTDYASSTVRGHSASFTMSGIATGATPVGNFDNGLQDFAVFAVPAVPEPGTFALIGLGTGALLFFRRRK